MQQSQEDTSISKFLNSIGPWREFIVIGGGFALFIYKLYLADPELENIPVGTRDIDSLIPRRVPEISKKNRHLAMTYLPWQILICAVCNSSYAEDHQSISWARS